MAGHEALIRLAELDLQLQQGASSIAGNLTCQSVLLARDIAAVQRIGDDVEVLLVYVPACFLTSRQGEVRCPMSSCFRFHNKH